MRRVLLGVVLLFTLGCSGMTEVLLEAATGGSVTIGEDGSFEMTMEDGTRLRTIPNGPLPQDFPMPPPWDGATTETLVITTSSSGMESTLATYTLARPREEVVERYLEWGREQGLDEPKRTSESTAGTASETLSWRGPEGPYLVTISEALGQASVTIGTTPVDQWKAQ